MSGSPSKHEKAMLLQRDVLNAGKDAWHWDVAHEKYRLDNSRFENDGRHWIGQGLHSALKEMFGYWEVNDDQIELTPDGMIPHLFITRAAYERMKQVYAQHAVPGQQGGRA